MQDTISKRIRQLIDELVALSPLKPKEDLPKLCDVWRAILSAEGVSLWLRNDYTNQWQLTSTAGEFSHGGSEEMSAANGNNLLESCAHIQLPEMVLAPVPTTIQTETQKTARPVHLLCVPFHIPMGVTLHGAAFPKGTDHLQAAIVANFVNFIEAAKNPIQDFVLAGKVSGLAIANAFRSEQREILVQLNSLAAHYLTTERTEPAKSQKNYLKELLVLIKSTLQVKSVSIFHQDESRDRIRCVATSGLADDQGRPISGDDISNVFYSRGEGLTGKCFATGLPFISAWEEGSGVTEAEKLRELQSPPKEASPWVIYPIGLPPSVEDNEGKQRVVGVIRCVGNADGQKSSVLKHFDPIQIQTLEFIAAQVAPVLETLESSVKRERQISIIKHDLFAPVRMMQDTVDEVMSGVMSGKELRQHDLADIGMASLVIKNLAEQLSVDPLDIKNFSPRPTFLEGGIVARLKNMLSHFARVEKDMTIRFSDMRLIPRLLIDPMLVERVLSNLIINAVKYGEPNSAVVVEARETSIAYEVTVSNVGIGILEEDAERIFHGTYRGRNVRHHIGTGLGLKVARAIMERHGGRLLLVSRHAPTVFAMLFPKQLAHRMSSRG